MNDIRRVKQEQREKHPGFELYLNCMTRALFGGLASFCLTFSGAYFSQKLISSKIPYPLKVNVLVSSLAATGVSYYFTSKNSASCQAAWMAFEDKHTALKESEF